jgi:hypothetical protein
MATLTTILEDQASTIPLDLSINLTKRRKSYPYDLPPIPKKTQLNQFHFHHLHEFELNDKMHHYV